MLDIVNWNDNTLLLHVFASIPLELEFAIFVDFCTDGSNLEGDVHILFFRVGTSNGFQHGLIYIFCKN